MSVRVSESSRLERIGLGEVDWDELDSFSDRVIFQTREWLDFVARTQQAEPIVATVSQGGRRVGYFTGLVAKRYGMRILGSPFPGWTTSTMGFNLEEGADRPAAAKGLADFAFGPLRCMHLEFKDRALQSGDLEGLGFKSSATVTFEVDLAPDEEVIFGRMTSACRRAIRKGVKEGVQIEVASGVGFADDYYAQLLDVFSKQSLKPMYGVERVGELIRCLEPTGRLLLLRALAPDGTVIATGIFPAMNGVAYFWGGASWRSHQILRPNEAIFWHAMRYWKEHGMRVLDMGGGGDYKRKYAPRELSVPFFRKSRFAPVMVLREGASAMTRVRQHDGVASLVRGPFGRGGGGGD
jgi:CelD/BcsL family acetyltransferase involved in cellulose biosynthesis